MDKPTIFFSHSSVDRDQLNRLKDLFCTKTGGAIDVFLSSDGQSIPLGRNWVYRVQEGLEAAKLMLVFITPNSIGSPWVYFEAGYSYAKSVRVIPIGFLGVDLAQIRPPLSFLQGFNITSADTLNNLIALANDQFGHKHNPLFLPEEYQRIVGTGATASIGPFADVLDLIDNVGFRIALKGEPEKLIACISEILTDASIEHQSGESSIHMRGVAMFVQGGIPPTRLSIDADPAAIHATFPILLKIIASIGTKGVEGVGVDFKLLSGLEIAGETHKITARLYDDSEIKLGPNPKDGLLFRNLQFKTGYYHHPLKTGYYHHLRASGSSRVNAGDLTGLDLPKYVKGNAYVTMIPTSDAFHPEDAAALLKLLKANGVIYDEHNQF